MEQNARCEKRDIFAQIVKIESRLEHLRFLSALPGAFPRKFFNAGLGEGEINVSFARYVATLLLFLLVSCKSINGRVLLEADYSQFVLFGRRLHDKQRHPLGDYSTQAS